MFSSMVGTLSVAVLLSVLVMIVAVLAEGRGRHVARLFFGLRSRSTLDEVLAEVPRPETDWELVEQVHSVPDRAAPSERVAAWAAETAHNAGKVVVERASAISQSQEQHDGPRTGELSLAQR